MTTATSKSTRFPTSRSVRSWVRSHDTHTDVDPRDVAAAFRRIFGRDPDASDGGTSDQYSHVCAAVG
jgi:hypothetical protein